MQAAFYMVEVNSGNMVSQNPSSSEVDLEALQVLINQLFGKLINK